MSRKVKIPELTWRYVGDESPEKKAESEKQLDLAYKRIFDLAAQNIKQRKQQKAGKAIKPVKSANK